MKTNISWEDLIAVLNDDSKSAEDKAWDVYSYMKENVGTNEFSSEEARTLLLCYMKLDVKRPSLVHSLMLAIALKMSEVYADFKLINFMNMWKGSNLREDDKSPQTGKDGKKYASLLEKVTKSYIQYKIAHPQETLEDPFRNVVNAEAARLGYEPIRIGFVDYYDGSRNFFHVYDNQSRHFVAKSPAVRPNVGDFVYFMPVVPKDDPFKSALIQRVADKYEGREKFGVVAAEVLIVNKEKNFVKYKTEDGDEGFCNLDRCPKGVKKGDATRLIMFMKRGKDGEKRPYVGEGF